MSGVEILVIVLTKPGHSSTRSFVIVGTHLFRVNNSSLVYSFDLC